MDNSSTTIVSLFEYQCPKKIRITSDMPSKHSQVLFYLHLCQNNSLSLLTMLYSLVETMDDNNFSMKVVFDIFHDSHLLTSVFAPNHKQLINRPIETKNSFLFG